MVSSGISGTDLISCFLYYRILPPISCCMPKRSRSIRRECNATTDRFRRWRRSANRRWTLTWPRSRGWADAAKSPDILVPKFLLSFEVNYKYRMQLTKLLEVSQCAHNTRHLQYTLEERQKYQVHMNDKCTKYVYLQRISEWFFFCRNTGMSSTPTWP